MAVYTISIQELVDVEFDFGLMNYPIFESTYRAGLNQKILDHYRNYEIGFESEEMFKFALNRRMSEIMPYYNKLYESEKIVFDPLQTIDFTDEGMSEAENTSSSDSTSTNESGSKSRGRAVSSDTPQTQLSGDEDYATSVSDTASDSEGTGSGTTVAAGTDTATGNVTHRMTGSQGPAAELLMTYRASLLNIDMMIVGNVADLFMGLWNTNDSYTTNGRFYGHGFGYPGI